MSNLISKRIRGFRDILPQESKKFLHIEKIIHCVTPLFNTHQVRLPALESIDLLIPTPTTSVLTSYVPNTALMT